MTERRWDEQIQMNPYSPLAKSALPQALLNDQMDLLFPILTRIPLQNIPLLLLFPLCITLLIERLQLLKFLLSRLRQSMVITLKVL